MVRGDDGDEPVLHEEILMVDCVDMDHSMNNLLLAVALRKIKGKG
jgi:hypothetical protein